MKKCFICCVILAFGLFPLDIYSQNCKPQPISIGLQISKVNIDKLQAAADSVSRDTTPKGVFMMLYYGQGTGELTIDAQVSPKNFVRGISGFLDQGTGWAWQNDSQPYIVLWNTLSGHPIEDSDLLPCEKLRYENIIEWNLLLILDRVNSGKK